MPADWLDELAAKVAAMTPEGWKIGPINYADIYGGGEVIVLVIKDNERTVPDAAGIVALRNEAARLIGEAQKVERLEKIEAAWDAERERCAKIADEMAAKCMEAVCASRTCIDPECAQQRSMAKACRGVADEIRKGSGK